ncbi:DNA-binding response regulator, partial [Vibrio harveyi]
RKKLASFLPDIDLVKNRRTKGFYLNYPVVVR